MNTVNAPHAAARPTVAPPPRVTIVVTSACHLCEDAVAELSRRARSGVLELEVVEADTAPGEDLLSRHRPMMFPLVVVGGAYFSAGRLPRRKLDKVLSVGRDW